MRCRTLAKRNSTRQCYDVRIELVVGVVLPHTVVVQVAHAETQLSGNMEEQLTRTMTHAGQHVPLRDSALKVVVVEESAQETGE